jgi:hypothetical protein
MLLRTRPLLLLLGLLLLLLCARAPSLLRCGDVGAVTWFVTGSDGGRRLKKERPLRYELT